MSIINRQEAIDKLGNNITSTADVTSNLNPANSPIKHINLKQYLTEFINYLFPDTNIDLYGKSPIIRNTDTPANTNYKNLVYEQIVPVGGIIMYGKAGDNSNINDELDGYLYCDGRVYDTTISTNFKYKRLYAIIGQSFHNPGNPLHGLSPAANMLYLPDFRSKSPIGYDAMGGSNVRVETGNGNNTQGIGNMGGSNTTVLSLLNIPIHNHGVSKGNVSWSMSATTSSNGSHTHTYDDNQSSLPTKNDGENGSGITYVTADRSTSDVSRVTSSNGSHTHTIDVSGYTLTGNTDNAGNANPTPINNRSAYVVTNYIIKY